MTRDMDLIRTILLEIEDHQNPLGGMRIKAPGYSPDQIAYHTMLLAQAGLIDAADGTHFGGMAWIPKNLTWRGHEFLDAARSEKVWQKLKAELKDRGVSVPFRLIEELTIKIAATYLGLS